MTNSMIKQIEKLKIMSASELRKKYIKVFGEESRSNHQNYLWRRIAWRLQQLEYGGLSERAKQRAATLANEADLRIKPPQGIFNDLSDQNVQQESNNTKSTNKNKRLPMPGTVLTRKYKGEIICVTVIENGFEYKGEIYKSLSAVAKAITNTNWNGYTFFKINKDNNKG